MCARSIIIIIMGDRIGEQMCARSVIINRGSYMSTHVLLNLLNELG